MMFVIYILLCSLWSLCDVIYINLSFVLMEIKKQKKYFKISLVFAQGLGHSPRQRKIKKQVFAEGLDHSPRQRISQKK